MTHSSVTISNQVEKHRSSVEGMRILIVYTRWNSEITKALVKSVIATLETYQIRDIDILSVPGSFELPFAIQASIQQGMYCSPRIEYGAVIPIGVLIKGETKHFEYISKTVAQQLMEVGMKQEIPVLFGVLTCLTLDQARQRAGLDGEMESLGVSWAHAAVEMALIRYQTIRPVSYKKDTSL